MALVIYTYNKIITVIEQRLKDTGVMVNVGNSFINSVVQEIVNSNLWWWLKRDISLKFETTKKDDYGTVVLRLPEEIQDIVYAWRDGKREPTDIVSREKAQIFINNNNDNRDAQKVWIYDETCLTDDEEDTPTKLKLKSSSAGDNPASIYLVGTDSNDFFTSETKDLEGEVEVESEKIYKKITAIYKTSAMAGTLTVKMGDTEILTNLPADTLMYKTKKIYCNPVNNDVNLVCIGFRKAINYDSPTDIPDFPPEFIPSVLIPRLQMEVSAFDKDSQLYQGGLLSYQAGMQGMIRMNNIQLTREYRGIDLLKMMKYPSSDAE